MLLAGTSSWKLDWQGGRVQCFAAGVNVPQEGGGRGVVTDDKEDSKRLPQKCIREVLCIFSETILSSPNKTPEEEWRRGKVLQKQPLTLVFM